MSTLEDIIAQDRKQLARTTKLAYNDAHPHEDGDQSPISGLVPGTAGQSLVDVWCGGSMLGIVMDTKLPSYIRDQVAPPLVQQCAFGDAPAVAAALAATHASALPSLLSMRHTDIRMTMLHFCISGARSLAFLPPRERAAADHLRVARLLLDAGAGLEDKDVLGMTALHHATSGAFSRESLGIANELLLRGANVSPRNRAGRTPLIELAMVCFTDPGKLPAARLLLEAGCDATLPDTDGFTAAKLAGMNRTLRPEFTDALSAAALRKRTGAGRTLEGSRMRLKGLKSAPELNGQMVRVGAYDPYAGRYATYLEAGSSAEGSGSGAAAGGGGGTTARAIKPENLEEEGPTGPPCSACGQRQTGELLRCSSCLLAFYCSRDCQRVHWKAGHKEACKPAGEAKRTVLLPVPADAASRLRMRRLVGKEEVSTAQWDMSGMPVGQATLLKVQMAISPLTDASKEAVVAYNESRQLSFLLTPQEQPAHREVLKAIQSSSNACRGLFKAYLAAVSVEQGLQITVSTPLEMQSW